MNMVCKPHEEVNVNDPLDPKNGLEQTQDSVLLLAASILESRAAACLRRATNLEATDIGESCKMACRASQLAKTAKTLREHVAEKG